MIKFGQLNIEGFCSIIELSLNLASNNGVTIIKGENGAGKTTMLSAINWAIYGKTLKEGVSEVNTKKKYQKSNYKGTMVSIFFDKDNVTHQIIRCSNYKGDVLGSKGKDTLHYLIDNVEVAEKKKVGIQKLIIDNLGMTSKLFSSSIMFGQGVKRVIQESGADKKKLFEEVFGLEYLNIARAIAQKYRDKQLEKFKEVSNKMTSLKKNLADTQDTYKELRNSEREFSVNIRKESRGIKSDIKDIRLELKEVEFSPKLLAKYNKELEQHVKKLSELRANFNSKAAELNNVLSVDGLSTLIGKIENLIKTKRVTKALATLTELKEAIITVNSFNDSKEGLQNKINSCKSSISELNNKSRLLTSKELQITSLEKRLANLKDKKNDILSPKYKAKAKNLKISIEELQVTFEKHQKEVEDYNWVIQDPLGNNGIKTYIFESSLDLLNKALNKYSDILGLRVEFGVDLNSTKKDFYTLIEIDGEILDYDELSGGQKQLIHIAMAFAMHESCTYSKGINILFLDEVFESLCKSNMEIVVELIKSIAQNKSVYIITHQESLPLSNSKTIVVEKKDKLSKFTF